MTETEQAFSTDNATTSEIERLRAVAEAATAWRNSDDLQLLGVDEIGEELVAAVDALTALPNTQEPCDTCSSTAAGCAECQPTTLEARIEAAIAQSLERFATEPYGDLACVGAARAALVATAAIRDLISGLACDPTEAATDAAATA